jgi:hypothetical protein
MPTRKRKSPKSELSATIQVLERRLSVSSEILYSTAVSVKTPPPSPCPRLHGGLLLVIAHVKEREARTMVVIGYNPYECQWHPARDREAVLASTGLHLCSRNHSSILTTTTTTAVCMYVLAYYFLKPRNTSNKTSFFILLYIF